MAPNTWSDRPSKYPYKCAISGRSKPEDGPYYETAFDYFTEPDGPPCRLIISAKYLLAPFKNGKAPYRVVTEPEFKDLLEQIDTLTAERDQLAHELITAEQELEHERDVFARARVRKGRKGPEA